MSSRDERRDSDRRERRSPPRRHRSPNVRGGTRCADCDFATFSTESLNAHCRRTGHKPRDDGKTRDTRPRRRSSSRERRRRSDSRERRRRSDSRERDAPPKEKKPDPAPKSVPEKPKKPDPAPVGVPGMVPDHIRRSLYVLQDYMNRTEREPIIGLEYILEYKVQVRFDKMDVKYFCEICEMDSGVIPMVDHLCGFKHRKLYVAKEYPYILKALFKTKEDKAVFMRRIAMGIEQEEGTKMYKTDSLIRTVPVMNVKSTEAKQSKRRTRWDPEGDRQKKMEQALDFLDSYEIDTKDDVATVTKLLEKMSAELKVHTDKLREEALFPAKVARAKGVAGTMVRNAVITWMYQRHVARVQRLREKRDLALNLSRPEVPFQPNNAAFPQWPFNQNIQMPGNTMRSQPADLQIDPEDEDIQFLKNLMELLDVLPDSLTEEDDSPIDAEFLLLLKSALLDKTENLEDMPADQLMQLVQDLVGMDNVPQNIMAPKNPAAIGDLNSNVLMQMASTANMALPVANVQAVPNLLRPMAAPLQNLQVNVNSLLPENTNIQKRDLLLKGNSSGMPMAQTTYQRPYMERQMATIALPVANAQAGPIPIRPMVAPLQNLQVNVNSLLPENANIQKRDLLLKGNSSGMPMAQTTYQRPYMASTATIALPVANAQAGPIPIRPMAPLQNLQVNVKSLLPEITNNQTRDLLLKGNSSGMPMAQTTHQRPYMERQPGPASTSQIAAGFGFEGRLAEKFGNKRRSRFDDPAQPMGYMLNEPTHDRSSGVHRRKLDEPPFSRNIPTEGVNREYGDEGASFSRVSLPLGSQERFLDDGYNCDLIRDIRAHATRPDFGERNLPPFEEPAWVERDTDMRYSKRARLDSDVMSVQSAEWGGRYPDESDSPGTIAPQLSADLLKRIRGKDLFTVSAILSEVAEGRPST